MANDIKEIKPGIGLGVLKFGITRDTAQLLLGKPDEKELSASDDEEQFESWHYDELEVSMSFSREDDWRLVTLSVNSNDYLFHGKTLIGKTQKELLAFLQEQNIEDLEIEDWSTDENPDHELISSDLIGVNFWLEGNVVSEIQWGPLFIDDDTVDWPE